MTSKHLSASAALLALLALYAPAGAAGIENREILGARIGAVIGDAGIDEAFGAGSELELYFVEGFGTWWGLGLSLSSHNFGASLDTLGNIDYIGENREVEMSVFSVTASAFALKHLGGRFTATGEAGGGLYAMTASIPAGFYEGSHTENRIGLCAGAGMLFRVSRGLSLNLNAKYHYVFVGNDMEEPIHAYTGQSGASFYQIALGILLFTS